MTGAGLRAKQGARHAAPANATPNDGNALARPVSNQQSDAISAPAILHPYGGMDGRSPRPCQVAAWPDQTGNDATVRKLRERGTPSPRATSPLPTSLRSRTSCAATLPAEGTDTVSTAAGDAVWAFIRHPHLYDPGKLRPIAAYPAHGSEAGPQQPFRETSGGTPGRKVTGARSIGMSMISTGSGTIKEAISTIRYKSSRKPRACASALCSAERWRS